MSRETVRKLRAGYEAFRTGDERSFVEFLHSDFKYRARAELPGGGEFVGPQVFDQRLVELREMFPHLRFEARDFLVSNEHVVVILRWRGRGDRSGVEVAEEVVHVWRIRDGKGIELQVFSDKAEALEAAGFR